MNSHFLIGYARVISRRAIFVTRREMTRLKVTSGVAVVQCSIMQGLFVHICESCVSDDYRTSDADAALEIQI